METKKKERCKKRWCTFWILFENGEQSGLNLSGLLLIVRLQKLGQNVRNSSQMLRTAVFAQYGQVLDSRLANLLAKWQQNPRSIDKWTKRVYLRKVFSNYSYVLVLAQIKNGIDGNVHFFGKVLEESSYELRRKLLLFDTSFGSRHDLQIRALMLQLP